MFAKRFSQVPSLLAPVRPKTQFTQKCNLHLHEYQSQKIMQKFGVNVSLGDVATTPEEALAIAHNMGNHFLIIFFEITVLNSRIKINRKKWSTRLCS